MGTKRTRKKKKPAVRQSRLPGIAQEIPAIETAADAYVKIRDRRMTLTKEEVAAQTALVSSMKGAKVEVYRTVAGLLCTIVAGKDKVKVKAADEDGDGADGEE